MLVTMWYWKSKQQFLRLSRNLQRDCTLCYFPVALVGFYKFGNSVKDNIHIMLEKPNWLIAMANLLVVIHVIGGHQIFAMPVFDMIETYLVKKMKFEPSSALCFTVRTLYVGLTMFIGITIPFLGGLLGFFGGFALAPTSYCLPCIIWLAIYKPQRFSFSWWSNWEHHPHGQELPFLLDMDQRALELKIYGDERC